MEQGQSHEDFFMLHFIYIADGNTMPVCMTGTETCPCAHFLFERLVNARSDSFSIIKH
jgi:hypothetical protein